MWLLNPDVAFKPGQTIRWRGSVLGLGPNGYDVIAAPGAGINMGNGRVVDADEEQGCVSLDIFHVCIADDADLTSDGSQTRPVDTSGPSLMDCIWTVDFFYITLFFAVLILRFTWVISTALDRVDSHGGGTPYISLLFVIFPLGCVASPLVYVLMQPTSQWHIGMVGIMHVATVLGLLFGVSCILQEGWSGSPVYLQLVTFTLMSLQRPFLFSALYPYVLHIFGHQHFGALSGLVLALSGAATALQYPLIVAVKVHLDGNYFWADVGVLGASMLVVAPLPWLMARRVAEAEAAVGNK
jgi:hypothetical protein